MKDSYIGSAWGEYTEFEFRWLETLLTKDILKKSTIVEICERLRFQQVPKDMKNMSGAELGNVLLNDVAKSELLPVVISIVSEKYPEKPTFLEAQEVYASLSIVSKPALRKITLSLTKNSDLRLLLVEDKEKDHFSKEMLLGLILKILYS